MQHLLYAPRPEYPRPDRQRAFVNGVDWINLNGPWQFRFDGDRSGIEQQWHQPGGADWREQIMVPFCWESLAAWGEGDSAGNENYYATRVYRNPLEVNKSNHRTAARYEVGWYRKQVEIPDNAHWADKRVILTIGAADFFTDCWCEGHHLGHNEGGYTPFEFDLTDHLIRRSDGTRYGLVILRVEDPMDNHEQPVGKQWRWYTPTSGIWQTVFVEPRSRSHVDYFRITSNIDDGSVHFEVFCKDTPNGANVQVEIIPPGDGPRSHVDIPIQNGRGEVTHHVNPLMLWEPGHPHLYTIHFSLEVNGASVDHLKSYFGMRKITAREMSESDAPGALCLNNDPIYLRGALYQSFYPEGVYTAGDVQTIIDDLEYARKVGFDFLRIHIKVDDPLLLYHADRMGMLLMADLPNFGEGGDTQLGRDRFEALMRETIKRDFNHPSIVAWCLFNETWGFGGQVEFVKLFDQIPIKDALARKEIERMTRPIQSEEKKLVEKLANLSAQKWVQEMWRTAKSLDGTRLIEDMSVVFWEHVEYYGHGETDINSWHFYNNDYQNAKEHIEKGRIEHIQGINPVFLRRIQTGSSAANHE
jgi:beta-galactosidase/beta-glucuronidase